MSLPSQSSRNATRSSQVHYRRSRSGPARRIISVVVILAIIALVWYTLIRPRANRLAENEQTNSDTTSQTNAQPNSPTNAQTNTDNTIAGKFASNSQDDPPKIINNSSTRLLPGAGDRPNTDQDLDRALDSTAGSNSGSRSGLNTPTTPPSGNNDILASAADQAESQPQSQPETSPQINNPAGIRLQLDAARRLVSSNDRVAARKLLSQTLLNADISDTEAQYLRDELTAINEVLLFSPVADSKDPMTETYTIASGDSLSRIASRRELATHWKLIARINQIADPSKIRLGQNLKLVRGPFHAIVNKSDHRLDIYHGSPANPKDWLYIRSFDVGLGSNDGTPVGEFVVSANKLENPGWVNPRNAREQYDAEDPDNPIGEYWIGITGVGQYASLTSLGIHGTIDQSSIGGDESMGCVRLAQGDIDTVYELLAEHISRVLITP
jgi:lipoprotein-anchoring transpeptidase ErfK/SrfK